jgi:periplasmic protein TonB
MAMQSSTMQRTGPVAVVIGLHLVFIYALCMTMGIVKVPFVPHDVTVVDVPDTQTKPDPEPVIEKPKLETEVAPTDVTLPKIEIDVPPDAAPAAITAETTPAVANPGDSHPLSATSRVDPIYPPGERRMNHEGTVRLQVQVDAAGRVLDVQVGRSSGFPALDQSAMEAVKRWRFAPKMEAGQAVGTWGSVAVTYQLK